MGGCQHERVERYRFMETMTDQAYGKMLLYRANDQEKAEFFGVLLEEKEGPLCEVQVEGLLSPCRMELGRGPCSLPQIGLVLPYYASSLKNRVLSDEAFIFLRNQVERTLEAAKSNGITFSSISAHNIREHDGKWFIVNLNLGRPFIQRKGLNSYEMVQAAAVCIQSCCPKACECTTAWNLIISGRQHQALSQIKTKYPSRWSAISNMLYKPQPAKLEQKAALVETPRFNAQNCMQKANAQTYSFSKEPLCVSLKYNSNIVKPQQPLVQKCQPKLKLLTISPEPAKAPLHYPLIAGHNPASPVVYGSESRYNLPETKFSSRGKLKQFSGSKPEQPITQPAAFRQGSQGEAVSRCMTVQSSGSRGKENLHEASLVAVVNQLVEPLPQSVVKGSNLMPEPLGKDQSQVQPPLQEEDIYYCGPLQLGRSASQLDCHNKSLSIQVRESELSVNSFKSQKYRRHRNLYCFNADSVLI